jgi:tetratricopeptide (TPR) repeat protein
VVRRLRQAGQHRQDVISVAEAELVRSLDGHLGGEAKLEGEALGRQLGYRIARGNYQLWKLSALVAPYRTFNGGAIVPPEKQAEARARSLAYYENTQSLLRLLQANRDPQGHGYPSPQVDKDDRARAESLGWKGLEQWSFVSPAGAALALARFAVHGESPFWGPVSVSLRPALADLDRGYATKALALVGEAEKELEVAVKRHEEKPDALIDAIDAHAEVLVALGRKEEAIAQWQRVLDGYPTATKYKDLEKKIEDLLAMSPEATQFAGAVKSCSNDLYTLMPGAMSRARRADGRKGVRKQIDQVAAACRGPMAVGFLASAWQFGVQEALKAGDCDLYREIKAEAARQTASLGANVVDGLARAAGNACGEQLAEMNR